MCAVCVQTDAHSSSSQETWCRVCQAVAESESGRSIGHDVIRDCWCRPIIIGSLKMSSGYLVLLFLFSCLDSTEGQRAIFTGLLAERKAEGTKNNGEEGVHKVL